MKNSILITACIVLSLISCKKNNAESVDNAQQSINSLNMDETQSYTYIASDSERAKVTFQNAGADHTITINSNNTKFVLDKKDGDEDTQIYERNGVQAKLTKDSLFIIQDNQVIPLVLSK
ncbi:hypothetical protein [Frigoriflavimonas asaccharolytica]|uniref:Uncharacterized protein n=1 Tax=Frigoriflavimonas asaccharolytica TaxID=2735899 RepID=A0A8J8K951_9FLAO|nr:hypothetical protein [Frigoriflavimonas asaccharolytica]NRS93513.1 hypothetical protein [Frigoriflavimonas asaccharolytica]